MIAWVTHHNVQPLIAVLLLLAGWPSAGISQSADPDIELYLRQYENTLNRLQKVYFEGEYTREAISRHPPPLDSLNDMKDTVYGAGSFATDGMRFSLRSYRWGHDRGPAKPISSRKKAQYGSEGMSFVSGAPWNTQDAVAERTETVSP